MKSVVRPELPTAAAGPSQAPPAAVDNSAPRSTRPEPTYKSGKTVQRTGTTSVEENRGNSVREMAEDFGAMDWIDKAAVYE